MPPLPFASLSKSGDADRDQLQWDWVNKINWWAKSFLQSLLFLSLLTEVKKKKWYCWKVVQKTPTTAQFRFSKWFAKTLCMCISWKCVWDIALTFCHSLTLILYPIHPSAAAAAAAICCTVGCHRRATHCFTQFTGLPSLSQLKSHGTECNLQKTNKQTITVWVSF